MRRRDAMSVETRRGAKRAGFDGRGWGKGGEEDEERESRDYLDKAWLSTPKVGRGKKKGRKEAAID